MEVKIGDYLKQNTLHSFIVSCLEYRWNYENVLQYVFEAASPLLLPVPGFKVL